MLKSLILIEITSLTSLYLLYKLKFKESDENQKVKVANGSSTGTTTNTVMEQKSYQLAYTTGGATLGIAQVEVTNSDYTSGKDETQTAFSVSISF